MWWPQDGSGGCESYTVYILYIAMAIEKLEHNQLKEKSRESVGEVRWRRQDGRRRPRNNQRQASLHKSKSLPDDGAKNKFEIENPMVVSGGGSVLLGEVVVSEEMMIINGILVYTCHHKPLGLAVSLSNSSSASSELSSWISTGFLCFGYERITTNASAYSAPQVRKWLCQRALLICYGGTPQTLAVSAVEYSPGFLFVLYSPIVFVFTFLLILFQFPIALVIPLSTLPNLIRRRFRPSSSAMFSPEADNPAGAGA
ncbi:tonoplast monosaccharide transporter2 [Striga asiatica]|uniref:Tonoplast monosaccharide transporter2 n=1 Tax=Striga asiatica TaxID=4170 RepID=A0A5A7QEM0_STRAF|nr:tonoplast monosaccharide transporter2 [Striga asiatica]